MDFLYLHLLDLFQDEPIECIDLLSYRKVHGNLAVEHLLKGMGLYPYGAKGKFSDLPDGERGFLPFPLKGQSEWPFDFSLGRSLDTLDEGGLKQETEIPLVRDCGFRSSFGKRLKRRVLRILHAN